MTMKIPELLTITWPFLAGIALGVAFFAALFWSVSRGLQSSRTALLFLTTFLLRMTMVATAFYFVGQGRLERFSLCLIGFLVGRSFILHSTRPATKKTYKPGQRNQCT